MKVLVVGYGSIGKRHIQNLLKLGKSEIIVCTKKKDPLLLRKGCKIYNSLKEAVKEKPEIGIITNVTSLHVKTSQKLAHANCHLFIEKPLSDSYDNLDNLSALVKKQKLITLIGCNLRFHPCIRKIKELILDKKIGKIISVKVENGSYLPDWHPYENYKKSYTSREDLGGGVVFTCIHEIDYLYWFFGDAKEVFSFTGRYSNLGINADDLSSILIRFKNDVIAEVHLDFFQRPNFRSCKIIGTRGTIYWDSDINKVKLYDVKKGKWTNKLQLRNYDYNKMYFDELLYFLECVKHRRRSINDLSHAIRTLKIALAIKKASKIKKSVKV